MDNSQTSERSEGVPAAEKQSEVADNSNNSEIVMNKKSGKLTSTKSNTPKR